MLALADLHRVSKEDWGGEARGAKGPRISDAWIMVIYPSSDVGQLVEGAYTHVYFLDCLGML